VKSVSQHFRPSRSGPSQLVRCSGHRETSAFDPKQTSLAMGRQIVVYYVLVTGACFTNKATGKTFESPKADLWRFSHGQAVEFFEYYDTAAVIATTR
jgi:ketosteroid isomerase-like protein